MIEEGEDAPAVTLPAYVDGERRRVDLGEHIGEGIVVLAFYPADFNPGCTSGSADLDALDLFAMGEDVSVFGVSPDSTYSHEAFAERYSLDIPLLSDDGAAAGEYGVGIETDTGERLLKRAVFVIDHRGTVRYAWATDDLEGGIEMAPVKRAVDDIGDDGMAVERYRAAYDEYVDGRESFEAGTSAYTDRDWTAARTRFEDARSAFDAAADCFGTAARFAETGDFGAIGDRAREKAGNLRHAAEWLAESADAFAGGNGAKGTEYREDAQPLVDAAEAVPDPAPPEAFDLTDGCVAIDDGVVGDAGGEPDASPRHDAAEGVAGSGFDGDLDIDVDLDAATDGAASGAGDAASGARDRTGGADERRDGGDATDGTGVDRTGVDGADDESDDEEPIELDLVDPTEGDEDDDERDGWDIPEQ